MAMKAMFKSPFTLTAARRGDYVGVCDSADDLPSSDEESEDEELENELKKANQKISLDEKLQKDKDEDSFLEKNIEQVNIGNLCSAAKAARSDVLSPVPDPKGDNDNNDNSDNSDSEYASETSDEEDEKVEEGQLDYGEEVYAAKRLSPIVSPTIPKAVYDADQLEYDIQAFPENDKEADPMEIFENVETDETVPGTQPKSPCLKPKKPSGKQPRRKPQAESKRKLASKKNKAPSKKRRVLAQKRVNTPCVGTEEQLGTASDLPVGKKPENRIIAKKGNSFCKPSGQARKGVYMVTHKGVAKVTQFGKSHTGRHLAADGALDFWKKRPAGIGLASRSFEYYEDVHARLVTFEEWFEMDVVEREQGDYGVLITAEHSEEEEMELIESVNKGRGIYWVNQGEEAIHFSAWDNAPISRVAWAIIKGVNAEDKFFKGKRYFDSFEEKVDVIWQYLPLK